MEGFENLDDLSCVLNPPVGRRRAWIGISPSARAAIPRATNAWPSSGIIRILLEMASLNKRGAVETMLLQCLHRKEQKKPGR
jgi:hypothetical protein